MNRLLVLFLFFSCSTIHAQWVDISMPSAIQTSFLYKTNSGNVLAFTDVGLQISTNFGDSWVYCPNDLNPNITVKVVVEKDSMLFAGTDFNGLFKSTNNGINWISIPLPGYYVTNVWSLLVKNNLLFAGTNAGVLKSTNNGVNWISCFQGFFVHNVDGLVYNNQYIFAATHLGASGKVYRSSNDGLTWDTVNSGIENFGLFQIQSCGSLVYGKSILGYYITTNNGNNWVKHNLTNNMNFLSKSGEYVTSGLYGTAMLSINCSGNFSYYTGGGINTLDVRDFIVSYPNFLIATSKGFYKSTDSGTHWLSANKGFTFNNYMGVGAYGSEIFTANYSIGRIFHIEGGLNWVISSGASGMTEVHKYCYNIASLFAFTENLLLRTPIYSPNTWSVVTLLSFEPKMFDACDNFIVASNINNTVYKSINDGQNWSSLGTIGLNYKKSRIKILTITSDNSTLAGVKYSDSQYDLFKLEYNSTVWNLINVLNISDFSPSVMKNLSGDLFAAAGSNVYYSTNNGLNWSVKNFGIPNDTITDFAKADNKIYCSTRHSGVYVSTNRGNVWSFYNTGLGNLNVNALSGYFSNLYAATDSGLYYADVYSGIISENTVPTQYYLSQNKPNPFNPSTKIEYLVSLPGRVMINVYDILGKKLITLLDEHKLPGNYTVNLNGSNLSSGIYFYRMEVNDFSYTRKMVLVN